MTERTLQGKLLTNPVITEPRKISLFYYFVYLFQLFIYNFLFHHEFFQFISLSLINTIAPYQGAKLPKRTRLIHYKKIAL